METQQVFRKDFKCFYRFPNSNFAINGPVNDLA